MSDPLIDSVIGQYQVLSRLGGGAMGVVYKARDLKLGRLVALKFLPPAWSHDEEAKQRFVREAQAASSTDHANICTVHDIQSADDGRLFIVMAFYDGQTLKQRLAHGLLPVEEALAIATQVADGLARAHAAGVVHRDIKPGNVIVTDDAVKVVDFGLATLAGSVQLTEAGTPMGTVTYMAPEQLRGHAATTQSDVWAVGVMLYEMLAGHPPFQGAYAEAVSYAIRHETPQALRTQRPEVSEEVEQLVFRALHKEPGVRFAGGRELARALRNVQGQSVPLDLQTAAIAVPQGLVGAVPPRPRRWRRLAAAAATVALAGAAATWYLLRPPVRTFIAVAPVANSTGDRTLEPYRLGLTLALTRELGESRVVRVLPYQRVTQLLRRFLVEGADVSSGEAVKAIESGSAAAVVVVPTLLYDRGAWKARADLKGPSGEAAGRVETGAIESSLTKEAASTLIAALAAKVEERFARGWTVVGSTSVPPAPFQSLEAAKAFEEGMSAYDAAEYADAREAFARAAREDPRHPLPVAWQSRVAQITGDRNAAAEAADRAEARLQGASPADALFVQAVVAEARRQDENAGRRYGELAAAYPDDPAGLIELAGFQDRSGQTAAAIGSYRHALDLDTRQPGPSLELCRLYNSTRMNDATQARSFGERARKAYAAIGSRLGEAQAMLCLADTLRVGSPAERVQARMLASEALASFEALHLRYSLARAHHYVAMTARAQDDLAAAAASWEQALASAKAAGNTLLEATALTNLGVTNTALGNRVKALDFYRQSYEAAERRGDDRSAAYSRANAGALLMEYGSEPESGVRFIEGALRVVRRIDDKNFEMFCLQLLAAHHRFTAQYAESRKELAQAMAIARERNRVDSVRSLLLDDGRVLMEMGDYVAAREAFTKALASEGATKTAELLIDLGRVQAMLGDTDAAAETLSKARGMAEASAGDVVPRLTTTVGLLAYASGRPKDARAAFEASSRLWTDDLPDAASVEARAYLGLLAGPAGASGGRAAVEASVQQARRMKRPALEAICRLCQAQLELRGGRPAMAMAALAPVALDDLNPEVKAQVHYWRGAAQSALGDGDDGALERREARRLLDGLAQTVPEPLRPRFLSRPDIRVMND